MNIFQLEQESLTILKIKEFLKEINSTYSLKSKEEYVSRLNNFRKVINFSWRKDQKEVIDNFVKYEKDIYVIHAVFGSGKTTLLLGLLIHGIINKLFRPEEIMFISFNICIKNEIKRKLKDYGVNSKVQVRTYDSIIYEICKNTGYPYMDLPNFEGKRKHVLNYLYEQGEFELKYQPKIIFMDECQDLEKSTFDVIRNFFPDTKFVFAGDIFQSIQKEPRESVLWYLLKTDEIQNIYRIYMNETPRVPKNTLKTLQKALTTYYPEFEEQIKSWKSGNNISNADIEWRRLNSYSHIFDEVENFCELHNPEEVMILTFSSAITVKGAMGDIARFRSFLSSKDFDINKNHKKNDPDKYFLSTANSSKGLERDYVICFLTFPLEKAFVNLSDDIVVNLITVALTRAKKKVIMYVPAYEDKFSRVLNIFQSCPKPNKTKIRQDDKTLDEFNYQDYLDAEHCVTELIKQNILKYDTRIKIKEYSKAFSFQKIFEDDNYRSVPKMITEEEKSFVGILIENLITSTWTNRWPDIFDSESISSNPMYLHCISRIKNLMKKYNDFKSKNSLSSNNQFEGIYMFAQVHVAIGDKLFIDLSPVTKDILQKYWTSLKPKCDMMKPKGSEVKIQSRVKMPWLTGVADTIATEKVNRNDKELDNITVVEIKASIDFEWKDDALIQALLYSLMSAKSFSTITLLNPFRNEKAQYHFNSKQINTLRNLVVQDILIWNMNCMMAKMYPMNKELEDLNTNDILFLNILEKEGKIYGCSLINLLSPIKCEILYYSYCSNIDESLNMKITKFNKESVITEEKMIEELNKILSFKIHSDKIILTNKISSKIKGKCVLFSNQFKFDYEDIKNSLDYTRNEEKLYSLDLEDVLSQNLLHITFLFLSYRFV